MRTISHGSIPEARDISQFRKISDEFGSKTAGILFLSPAWCPDFIALSVDLYRRWMTSKTLDESALNEIHEWVLAKSYNSIIVRSSGRNETIGDRGKYKSIPIAEYKCVGDLSHAITRVFECALLVDCTEEMGIIVQQFMPLSAKGHLSNEVRVSPTRNQWKYEFEHPWAPARGINSKFAPSLDANVRFTSAGSLHQSFRSIGKWCCDNIAPRVHIEWIHSDSQLWLLQLDIEWREFDNGVDPQVELSLSDGIRPDISAEQHLKCYSVGDDTPWKKLKNLSDFDFEDQNNAPIIFQLPARLIMDSKSDAPLRAALISEIRVLTGDRAVVRTDVQQDGIKPFNLPRTDTVNSREVLFWCDRTIADLLAQGVLEQNLIFLLHAFLPARASAWAYADPLSHTVSIDALWGLPDGIQVLPVDTYEVIPKRRKVIDPRSTYKPMFLSEAADGTWKYIKVLRTKARSKVLANSDLMEIAERTLAIANKLGEPAQIMWFSGIPTEYGVGRNLPWFRSREKLDPAPRIEAKYKDFDVRRPTDLDHLPLPHCTIRLLPEANLIRDESFLESVIVKAKAHNIPVKLEGSILGHVYYRLCEEGVGVILPNAAKYKRTRERQVFGKIVRDKIPLNIQRGGEEVIEATLRQSDILRGLAAKMIEELEEFLRALEPDDQLAELSDILEVVRGLAFNSGIDWQKLIDRADLKQTRNGGFFGRKVLIETSLPKIRHTSESSTELGLEQLARPEVDKNRASIPVSSLIGSIDRKSLYIELPEVGSAVRVCLQNGKLIIVQEAIPRGSLDERQGTLF